MKTFQAAAAVIVVVAVAGSLLLHAPAEKTGSYSNVPRFRAGGWFLGLYELTALRPLGTAKGSEIKALWWRGWALVLFSTALATCAAGWRRGSRFNALSKPPVSTSHRLRRVALGALGVYLVFQVLSCLWSDARGLSLAAAADRGIGVLWCLCIATRLRPSVAKRTAIAVAAAVCVAAALALGFHGNMASPWRGALTFPCSNPNFLAAILIVPLLLCGVGVARAIESLTVYRGAMRAKARTWLLALVAFAGGALLLSALLLTGCRGARFGLLIGCTVYAVYRMRGWWRLAPAGLCVLCLFVVALWSAGMFGPVTRGRTFTAWGRWLHFRASATLIAQRPLIGHGPAAHVRKVQPISEFTHPIEFHAHNELLEVASEVGIPIGLLFAGALALAPLAALKSGAPGRSRGSVLPPALAAGFVAMTCHQLVSQGVRYAEVACLFWTWLGLLIAMSAPERPLPRPDPLRPGPRSRSPATILVLLAALGVGGAVFGSLLWPGYAVKMRSAQMLRPGTPVRPWDEEFERQLSLDLSLQHRLELLHEQGRRLVLAAEAAATEAQVSTGRRRECRALVAEAGRVLTRLDDVAPDFGRVRELRRRVKELSRHLATHMPGEGASVLHRTRRSPSAGARP